MTPSDIPAVNRKLKEAYHRVKAPIVDLLAIQTRDPFRVLLATILSARTKDACTAAACERLFKVVTTPDDLRRISQDELEKLIYPVGFYRNKARAIHESARQIMTDFGGEMPDTMEELTQLRGVARKTASVVLQEVIKPDGPHDGVVVDTHVQRLSRRMGLVPATWENADKIEKRLMEIYPREEWNLAFVFIEHGRAVCTARKARCAECIVNQLCPRRGVQ